MGLHDRARDLGAITSLDRVAKPAAGFASRAVGHGPAKDLLSGTRLGHPLHPMLTDIPIGAFTGVSVLDLVGGPGASNAADLLVAAGLLSALPTVAAGISDWSDTYGADQRVGAVHAGANLTGLALYVASLVARRRGSRGVGRLLGLTGMATMIVGGYLGGYLSYSRGVGVNHAFDQEGPEDWTPVLGEADLADGKPTGATVGEATIVLYRDGDRVLAIGGRCSHAGGPLAEGSVDPVACTVRCPWHQSVFRLDDGAVAHGPASIPQAAYDTRIRDGNVEVRLRSA